MTSISVDNNRISNHIKGTITVLSDEPFYAIEARATKKGSDFGRGTGYDLLSDDASAVNGIVTFPSAVTSYTFDVECSELLTDGEYRISVYVLNEANVWDDTSVLLTSDGKTVTDKTGAVIRVQRNGSGVDEVYTSAYSGDAINNFIAEVLYG